MMNEWIINRWIAAIFLILLAGCSALTGDKGLFRDRSFDYQKAQTVPRLEIAAPEGKKINFDDAMPIPPQLTSSPGFKATPEQPIPEPPVLIHLDEQTGLVLSRKDQQEWIFMAQPKALVWQKLGQFWQQKNIPLAIDDINSGVMETSWLKQNPFQAKVGFWARITQMKKASRAKFRVQVTSDVEGIVGVLLSYAEIPESRYMQDKTRFSRLAANDILWQQQSEDKSVRSQALQALSQLFIAQKETLASQGEYLKPKRILLTQDGNHYPVLELEQEFAPAWSNIGRALQKAHIKVDDLNRSLGIYYIRYDAEDKKATTAYELKVTRAENDIHITVQINDDTLAPVEISQALLKQLQLLLEK